MTTLLSVWTIIVAVMILVIFYWAFSDRNKSRFDEASRIPMEDDDDVLTETDHG